ncbi:MAG: hypothetical protein RIS29_952 [Bacteroidota bacterium]|jgi:hypothetical protein
MLINQQTAVYEYMGKNNNMCSHYSWYIPISIL